MLKNYKFAGMNLSKSSWLFAICISLVGLISGCKSPDESIGSELIVAPSDLQVLSFEGNLKTVDFTKDSLGLFGELSHRVSWLVTFKGTISGAIKTFEGVSQIIDPSELKWGGEHDPSKSLKFFLKGEPVAVEISFVNSNLVSRDTIIVKETKIFNGDVLFDGLDKATKAAYGWPSFLVFPENDGEIFDAEPNDNEKYVVQGLRSFSLYGKDNDNSYFIGGIRQMKADGNKQYIDVFKSFNPDSVYFNAYIYGDGNSTTRMSIGVAEDDNLDGTYVDASEDAWEYAVKVNWVGWKLVSARYVDFARASEKNFGGSGNGKRQLDRIKKITFNLLSDPAGNSAGYIIDFPIITYGSAFDPAR